MSTTIRNFPPNWGNTHLTKHIDQAIFNVASTFANDNSWYPFLEKVDNSYQKIVDALVIQKNLLEGLFLMRSHAAYRAGSLLAMSGHNSETFPIIRSCLEYALYAIHLYKNEALCEAWIDRHRDENSLKLVKRGFTFSTVIDTLKSVDPENYLVAKDLYERTIDFGGHPNERAVTSSLEVNHDGAKSTYKQDYLSGGTEVHMHAVKSTAQVGLCSLLIFEQIYKEKFAIIGVSDELKYLKSRL